MSQQWFRMYSEFATDPKVQMLSESDQRRYIMLLCLRCSNGDVTLHDNEVAFQLRVTDESWAETKRTLIGKKLIDENNNPTAWDKRQFISDSSAERVSRHREKKKRACNVTVTPPDTDTDTDTELLGDISAVGEKVTPIRKRATQMPDDFEPNENNRQVARECGVSLAAEQQSFSDFHRSKGSTFKDWHLAFNTWLRNAKRFDHSKSPPPPKTNLGRYV